MSPEAVAVTFFADRQASLSREERLQLSDLAGMIRATTAGEKARLPWLKLASFGAARSEKNSLRHDANVISISGVEADYDGERVSFDEAVEIAEKAGLCALIYTSPSHAVDRPRWRALCPTSSELPPADRHRLVARLSGLYQGIFASESFTLSQSYYYGSVTNNPAHRVELVDGLCIDELDELDLIAIGKPNGHATANGSGAPLDVAELEAAIVTGASYHMPCARLAGLWKRCGVPLLDAHARLVALFDATFPPDRDARWRARRDDALRIVADIYRKDEAARSNGANPTPAATDPTGHAPTWPEPLGPAAYHGLAGDIIRAIAPRTEADPAALLLQFLTLAGCHLGNDTFYFVEGTRHAPRLFTIIVGKSSIARKGSALSQSRRLFEPAWLREHVTGGLSSGEGLIERVRDRATHEETDKKTGDRLIVEDDPGVADKRLLVVEEEFARVLRVKGRDQSILPDILRQAWDGHDLGVMTRKRGLRATAPHICVIGHITADELSQQLDDLSTANGFANRFLFCCARRSKLLPFGGGPEPASLDELRRRLALALDSAPRGEIGLDIIAKALWQAAYGQLATEGSGLIAALSARAAPQVLRLALIYALLDGSPAIGEAHLKAGLEVWRYAEASARFAFSGRTGNSVADRVLAGLRDAGTGGLPKTAVYELLGRHANAAGVNAALRLLLEQGLAEARAALATGQRGRPGEIWVAL